MKSIRLQKLIEHSNRYGFVAEKLKETSNKLAYFAESTSSKQDSRKGEISSLTKEENLVAYEYGPFGSSLRKNVIDQWWKHMVNLQDNIFPIHVTGLDELGTERTQRSAFLPRIRAHRSYETLAKEVLCKEVGVAQVTTLPASESSRPFILRSPYVEYLTVHQFCSIKGVDSVFNELIKQRLRWWKRFSNKQSNFTHLVEESKNDGTRAEISCNCSFGTETVETIHLHINDSDEIWQSNQHVIECCTTVEQAMLAYLDDALEQRMQEEEDHVTIENVLRLHPSMAPIKVIILAEDPSNEEQQDLVDRLSKEMRVAGISCHKLSFQSEGDAWRFADAIGTPFSLKIDIQTLQRGVVGIRHRDTTVIEFLHIAETTETLRKLLSS